LREGERGISVFLFVTCHLILGESNKELMIVESEPSNCGGRSRSLLTNGSRRSILARTGCPVFFDRRWGMHPDRQLHYDCTLSRAERGYERDFAVRKFQSIVMHIRLINANLPKARNLVSELAETEPRQ
jgi:hypothetical protein